MSTSAQALASSPHALLSGGGSGGHVFPGLAVATELERRGWRVGWAGSARGMEARIVARRGLEFFALPARPLVGRGALGKAQALLTLARSAIAARSLVRRTATRVVVGTGGYASAPAVLGSRLAGRPILLFEPNASVGVANRLLSRLAAEAAVVHETAARDLHCPTTTSGVPIRDEFFTRRQDLPAKSPFEILVLGGSQGARTLNQSLPQALARLASEDLQIHCTLQCGERNVDSAQAAKDHAGLDEAGSVTLEVVPFLDDVAGAMATAQLVVSRAGAITLAEICAAGRPALLVPLSLAGAHQAHNARRLAEAGAAEVLDEEGDVDRLTELLRSLVQDRGKLEAMAQAAQGLAHADAAERIADRVEALAGIDRGGKA